MKVKVHTFQLELSMKLLAELRKLSLPIGEDTDR